MLNFSWSNSCFCMRGGPSIASRTGGDCQNPLLDGKLLVPVSPASTDAVRDAITIPVGDVSEYELPAYVSAQVEFQLLLIAVVTGPEQDKKALRIELKRLVDARRGDIRSRAEFSGVSSSRKSVGPVRFVAEHAGEDNNELVGWLLSQGFKWLETDGTADQYCVSLTAEVLRTLVESGGYSHATTCCKPFCTSRNGFRARVCSVCLIALAAAGSLGALFGSIGR